MKALVLAAGKGVRMRPLTKEKPKPLVLLKGKPLLYHSLKALEKAGVKECGIVIGYKGKKISSYFGDRFGEIKLKYFNQGKPLGTAHAIATAEHWLENDFLVTSADVIVSENPYRKLMKKKGYKAVLVLRHSDSPERFGVVKTREDRVEDIIEKPKKAKSNAWVNAGIYRFSPEIFNAIRKTSKSLRKEFEITDSIKILLDENKKVGFIALDGPCMDIGSISDLEKAEKSEL